MFLFAETATIPTNLSVVNYDFSCKNRSLSNNQPGTGKNTPACAKRRLPGLRQQILIIENPGKKGDGHYGLPLKYALLMQKQ